MPDSPPPSAKKPRYTFDPTDTSKTKHRKYGVWDIYEERTDHKYDLSWVKQWREWPIVSLYFAIRNNLPYLSRMLSDIVSLPECRPLIFVIVLCELGLCFIPAFELICQGKLLQIVRVAVEDRKVDQTLLVMASVSTFITANASTWIRKAERKVSASVESRIQALYSVHMFKVLGRLDVPTFDDPIVKGEIEDCERESSRSSIAFSAMSCSLRSCAALIKLVTQTWILWGILDDQPSGFLMAALSGVYLLLYYSGAWSSYSRSWAATTRDEEYVRSQGLKTLVKEGQHRKEIVASGVYPFLLSLYAAAMAKLSGVNIADPSNMMNYGVDSEDSGFYQVLLQTLQVLPDIVFAIEAVRDPSTIPVSVTSLQLIRQTVSNLSWSFLTLKEDFKSTSKTLGSVKQLYDLLEVPNQVRVSVQKKGSTDSASETTPETDFEDPSLGIPFPENSQTLSSGVSIEFCNVSFKYPNTDIYVLRDVSFKIQQGQLCVIVGNNGSGKSTILKLVSRLYDPTEGHILLDGYDIKTLRLRDIRSAISVLFQDYTIFPLSLRDNIGLGSPANFSDVDAIKRAAELGGAADFVEKLPQGYDTYLERPVRDLFSRQYKGPPNPFSHFGKNDQGDGNSKRDLSGGQKQRIALSRTFLRTVGDDENVGLLVFDEPSASLDPTAEHDLFQRLRKLRGNKTMIFSSHRFGNLTRHADLILYIHESKVLEAGTHDQLIQRGGEYKRIWMLQAEAFL